MRNSRSDVVAAALRVLDEHGLEFCSMRRVAAELEVQPSALYHHVPNKQELLAFMADEITRPVLSVVGAGGADRASDVARAAGTTSAAGSPSVDETDGAEWEERATAARELCRALRDAMLAVRDGADVVATASAYRLGASRVETELAALVGVEGARTLLLFTFGHAQSTQTQRQAIEFGAFVAGAVTADTAAGGTDAGGTDAGGADAGGADAAEAATDGVEPDRLEVSYEHGLDIIIAGLASLAGGVVS